MHLLGDSVDLDNNIQATTYNDVNSAHANISPLQLTTLLEEGVVRLQEKNPSNKDDIDMLRPVTTVFLYALSNV